MIAAGESRKLGLLFSFGASQGQRTGGTWAADDSGARLGGPGDGQMPAAMASWCGQQMLSLTGNDDTTLADFLFSLSSDAEAPSRRSAAPLRHIARSLLHTSDRK